jgi:hypothetical protein
MDEEQVVDGHDESPFDLIVSEDKLCAYLKPKGDLSSIRPETIRDFLKDKGISYGIVEDQEMEEFLLGGSQQNQPRLVARGKEPKPGKDAEVIFFFEKDAHIIGAIRAGGAIDFRDKGEIPFVREGAFLVEKIPLVKAESGMDVYGNRIPIKDAKDVLLISGPGTKKGEDGLKIYAKVSGRPELLSDGKVRVLPELDVERDVGLETGHISFNGSIKVRGVIQEGFQVRGKKLSTQGIFKSEVEIDGDILVNGGIIGAKIFCKGNLKARYVSSATIEALGDVIVEGGVINSKIETDGAFIAHLLSGKILSSHISARKGIEANQVGSESSKACEIFIGSNAATKKFVAHLAAEIATYQGEQRKLRTLAEELNLQSTRLAGEIGKLTQQQARYLVAQRACKERINGCKMERDKVQAARAEQEMGGLVEQIRALEAPLGSLKRQQDEVPGKLSLLARKIAESENTIKALTQESQVALNLSDDEKDYPAVKVHGTIFEGTIVSGHRASLHLKENAGGVSLRERLITTTTPEGESESKWEMRIVHTTYP